MQIRKTLLTFPIYLVSVFLQENLKALKTERYMIHICTINILIFYGIGMLKFS